MQTNVIANKMVWWTKLLSLLHQLNLRTLAHSLRFDITLATHNISCYTSEFFPVTHFHLIVIASAHSYSLSYK